MEHPRAVKRIHGFFNPVSEHELRQLEKRRERITADEYERRRAALRSPGSTSYTTVYVMLAAGIVAISTAMLFAVFR